MKRDFFITAILAVIPAIAAMSASQPSTQPTPPIQPTGRLEGIITTPEGLAVWAGGNGSGIHITGASEDGLSKFDVASDTTMGGLYRADKLRPGFYDISIREGYINGIPYSPQEIFAVEIKPNERTVLNVTMARGEALIITGKPVYATIGAALAAEQAQSTGNPTPVPPSTSSAPPPTATAQSTPAAATGVTASAMPTHSIKSAHG